MKKVIALLILAILNFGCCPHKKFFDSGNAVANAGVEEIKIDIVNDLPLCAVQINGQKYTFLVDTGAPTVISEELFNSLHLTESYSSVVTDAQKNKRREKFVKLPELQIGNLIFKDIGCTVIKIEGELKCFGIDGIVGANLMSKLFFEFDYDNKRIRVSDDLSSFQVEKSDLTFDFTPKSSKTPIVKGKIFEKDVSFTFDTGFGGNIKIPNDYDYYQTKSQKDFITYNGVSGIGAYGASKKATTFVMKNSLSIDNRFFENEIIGSGNSTLIGNQFLKNYTFVIDWQKNKIYLTKNESVKKKDHISFGFSYLFINGKATVIAKVENRDIPLQLGDEVIAIDDVIFAEINPSEHCRYFLNKVEKEKSEIDISVKRKNEILSFHIKKQEFIK